MPSWDRLYEAAAGQGGYFTTAQAAEAGYSRQLLLKHLRGRRIVRARRGVYRLAQFPAGDREDLVIVWLWSEQEGVFSHETALSLHELSDALPAQIHITVPEAWRRRRLRMPDGVVLHHATLAEEDRTWVDQVPATTAARTLNDCADDDVDPILVRQAMVQGLRLGLFTRAEVKPVTRYLARFKAAAR